MRGSMFGVLVAGLALGSLISAETAAAQSPIPLSVEGRVGAAFPVGDLADHAQTGVGVGASATVQLFPNYGLYAGYSRTHFDLDIDGASAVDSGFAVGLTAAYPGLFGFTPWLGTGLIFHELDVRGTDAVPAGDTSAGFEVGAGVVVPVAPRMRITPGIGFRRYNAPFIGQTEAAISYVSAGVGLNIAF